MVGQERPGGRERREGHAAYPALLLLAFFVLVRPLGEWTRPAAAPLDCHRVAGRDLLTLERCHRLRPDDVELMADLGQVYEQTAQWDRAERVYRSAIEIDPDDGDIRLRLANLLLRRHETEEARRQALAVQRLQPGRQGAIDVIRRAAAGGSGR